MSNLVGQGHDGVVLAGLDVVVDESNEGCVETERKKVKCKPRRRTGLHQLNNKQVVWKIKNKKFIFAE